MYSSHFEQSDHNNFLLLFCVFLHQNLKEEKKANEKLMKDLKKMEPAPYMQSAVKSALYPLAGGVVGCTVGGPVGFLAGIKLGLAAALGGGILGKPNDLIITLNLLFPHFFLLFLKNFAALLNGSFGFTHLGVYKPLAGSLLTTKRRNTKWSTIK